MKKHTLFQVLNTSVRTFGCGLLLAAATTVQAASGTWTNSFGIEPAENNWSEVTNWLNGVVADGAGSTATFSNEFAAAATVNLDTPRTIGNLEVTLGAHTITNNGVDANVLTLESTTKPIIYVAPGMAATLRRTVMAGADGFVLDGGGQLNVFKATLSNVDPANTWSGGVILSNGTFQIQGDDISAGAHVGATVPALGGISSFTFYNGSVLNMLSDPSEAPSYGSAHADWIVPADHSGTIVMPPRWSGTSGQGGSGMNGTLTGGGTLNLQVRFVRGNIGGDWSAFTGQINVTPQNNNAEWRFGNVAGFPQASVDLGGAQTLNALYYPAPAADNSTVIPIGLLSGANPAARLNGSLTAGRTLTFRVGAKQTNPADVTIYAGGFFNGAGPLAVVWEGAGKWDIWGNSTHSGGTTISSGVLQIGDGFSETGSLGTGPVVNLGSLIIARSGTLTVPGEISGSGSVTINGFGSTIRLTGPNSYSGPTTVTAGTLVLGPGSTAGGDYTISDFAGFGAVLTAADAAATINGNVTFGTGGTYDVDLGTFGNPTVTAVTNAANLTLNGDVTVNVLGTNFSTGTITLIQYLGTRSGAGSFVLGPLPPHILGATLNDDLGNKRVTLTINEVNDFDPTVRWVGDAAGIWDVSNPANLIWREIGSGQLTNYYDGAPVRFDDTATGTTAIDVSTTVFPGGVTVSNSSKAYTFGGFGFISGPGPLTKTGDGKLTITNANDYTGLTTINAGTVQIGAGDDPGTAGTGGITNNGSLILVRTNALPLTLSGDLTGSGTITIPGLDKTTTLITFSPAVASTYAGGTSITNAAIQMGNAAANSLLNDGTGLGTGPATFWGDSQLDMFQSGTDGGDNGYDFNPILQVPAGQLLTYHLAGRCREASTLLGGGTINVRARWVRCYAVGDWSQFSGQINFYGAAVGVTSLRLNDTLGMPLARVHLLNQDGLGAVVRMMNQGAGELVYRIGALSGDPGTFIEGENGDGNDAPASTVWTVGGVNTDATFAGTTADSLQANAVHSFVKEGTGRWTLSGTNLHSGFTTVSNGVLALIADAGLSNSVRVATASPGSLSVTGRTDQTLFLGTATAVQSLGGDGAVRGNVVLGANATLDPGFSIGTLTITDGAVTLGGTTVVELDGASADSDRLVAPTINYGGTLILTNLGAVTGSKTYQLFTGTINGTFANVVTQDLSGVTWDLSELNAGRVMLVGPAGPPTMPTNLNFSITAGQLTLTWPENYTGWTVETNAVGVAVSDQWFAVPGSEAVHEITLDLDPARTNVFYRMRLLVP